ncbi:MAG: MCP four helix bundle domain-containing protein, partial [Deltaproteobacteria bacterium]|nr:MCP four helix bundle domain-containing protein [Deltaproteobacteria bacterium]
MNFFKSLNISTKLLVIFLILLGMMGVGGGVGLYNVSKITDAADELYYDAFISTNTLNSMEYEFISQRQALLLHIIVESK